MIYIVRFTICKQYLHVESLGILLSHLYLDLTDNLKNKP